MRIKALILNRYKRFLAVCMALALLCSALPASFINAAAEDVKKFADDFENSESTASWWQTEKLSTDNYSEDYSIKTDTDGSHYFVAAKSSTNNKTIFTTVKDAYVGNDPMKMLQVEYKIPEKTPAGLSNTGIVLYYDHDASGNAKMIALSPKANTDTQLLAVQTIGFWGTIPDLTVGVAYGETIRLTVKYDASQLVLKQAGEALAQAPGSTLPVDQYCGVFKMQLTFEKKIPDGSFVTVSSQSLQLQTGASVASAAVPFNPNFKFAFSAANSDAQGYVHINAVKAYYNLTAQDYADFYKDKYGVLLNKAQITVDDITLIDGAVIDYGNLSSEVKAILQGDGTVAKLDAKIVQRDNLQVQTDASKFETDFAAVLAIPNDGVDTGNSNTVKMMLRAYAALTSAAKSKVSSSVVQKVRALRSAYMSLVDVKSNIADDFESSTKSDAIWETSVFNNAPLVSDYLLTDKDGNHHMTTAVTDNNATNALNVITAVDTALWDESAEISRFEFDMTVPQPTPSGIANSRVMLYYDPKNSGKVLYFSFQAAQTVPTITVSAVGFTPTAAKTYTLTGINYGEKLRFTIEYDTSKLVSKNAAEFDSTWSAKTQLYGDFTLTVTAKKSSDGAFAIKRNSITVKTAATLASSQIPFNRNFMVGFSAKGSSAADYTQIDNVYVSTSIGNAQNEQYFKNKYGDLLRKKPTELVAGDKATLQNSLAEYNELKLLFVIPEFKTIIDELLLSYEVSGRAENDFSNFTENFETGLTRWYNGNPELDDSAFTIAESGGNHYLKVGNTATQIRPYGLFWPQTGSISALSVDMCIPSGQSTINIMKTPRLFLSFVNEDNYYALRFINSGIQWECKIDGAQSTGPLTAYPSNFDASKWFHVSATYSLATQKATIVVTQQAQSGDSVSFNTVSTYYLNGQFAIGYYSLYASSANSVYVGSDILYDNLSISFVPGDWDNDLDITDVIVYYTGNTFMAPGETLQLSGEQLNKTVSGVKIARISGDAGTTPKFIRENAYDGTIGASGASQAAAVDWETVPDAQILQITKNTLNVLIPSDIGEGVYAVRLYAKADLASDVILYVNNPEITFVQGNEGANAIRGGWLRIIGENMVPSGNAEDVRVLLEDSSGSFRQFAATVKTDDNYSLEIKIPSDMPYGDYKVYVHNGYGGETAWSAPKKFSVTKGHRELWPQQVYNVRNYGAVGDGKINDTPAAVSALNAIAKNGGGVLYFPAGAYRMISTIVIPQKTIVMGDGEGESHIMWSAENWQYGKVPETLISFGSSVEICNLSFEGSRFYNLFQNYGNGNGSRLDETVFHDVYIHDIRSFFEPYAGLASLGGGNNYEIGRKTAVEVANLIRAERYNANFWFIYAANTQLYNITTNEMFSTGGQGVPYSIVRATYLLMKNVKFYTAMVSTSSRVGAIIENNDFDNVTGQQQANGLYMANNYMHDRNGNNRELYTIDGLGAHYGLIPKYVDPTHYCITNKGIENHSLTGLMLMVVTGQGAGQIRVIKDNVGNVIELYDPLAVSSNRNCSWSIQTSRKDMYFINNKAYNGSAFGAYGEMTNAVWQGTDFQYFGEQIFTTGSQGVAQPIWYISIKGNSYTNSEYYIHGEGVFGGSGEMSGHSVIKFHNITYAPYLLRCVNISNNYMDKAYIYVHTAQADVLESMVIEKNNFAGKIERAVYFLSNITYINGLLMRENSYAERDSYYYSSQFGTKEQMDSATNVNKYNSKRALVMDAFLLSVSYDVNGDGKFSLKDCTLVRYSLLEMVTITDIQKKTADADGNNIVNLGDLVRLRQLLLNENSNNGDFGAGEGDDWGIDPFA